MPWDLEVLFGQELVRKLGPWLSSSYLKVQPKAFRLNRMLDGSQLKF